MNKALTPVKAIRAYCLDCSGDSAHEVKLCPISECPLYKYRLGKNPNRAGMGNKSPTFGKSSISARDIDTNK